MAELKVVSSPVNQPTLNPKVVSSAPTQQISIQQPQKPAPISVAKSPATQPKIASIGNANMQSPYEGKMSIAEFGQKIKAKYPEYQNKSDDELGNAFLSKYPQYQNKVIMPSAPQQPEGVHGLKGFALGATKGALSTVKGLGGMLKKGADIIPDALGYTNPLGMGVELLGKAGGFVEDKLQSANLTPESSSEKWGFGVEQVGEFFVPAGMATKAGKLAQASRLTQKVAQVSPLLAKIAPTGARIAGTAGTEGAATFGISKVQGETTKDALINAGFATVLSGAFEVASPFITKQGKAVLGKVFPNARIFQKEFSEVVDESFKQAFRPSTAGVKSVEQAAKNTDKFRLGVATIIENSTEQTIPKTVAETAEAASKIKKDIWSDVMKLSRESGEQGLKIDMESIAKQLDEVADNIAVKAVNPSAARYAADRAAFFRTLATTTPDIAEDMLAQLNKRSEAFWKGTRSLDDASAIAIDAATGNNIRRQLIDGIEGLQGIGYQTLRRQYGALNEVEKIATKRMLNLENKTNLGFYESLGNLLSGGDIVGGLINLSPGQVARGATTGLIGKGIQWLKNPDRITKNMFKDAYKVFQRARNDIIPPKGAPVISKQKMLPAPKVGAPMSSVNVPIIPQVSKVNTASEVASKLRRVGGPGSRRTNQKPGIGPKIVKKSDYELGKGAKYDAQVMKGKEVLDSVKNKGKNQLYSVAGAGAGLEKDKDGKIKFNPEKAAAGMALLAGGKVAMKKVKRIDKLTQKEMVKAIDYIRLKKPYDQIQEEYISKLVEKFNIPAKTLSGVANKLDELLTKVKKTGGPVKKKVDNIYKGSKELTTKVLRRLEGKGDISKQYISDLTNSGDIKQAERDIIRNVLNDFKGEKINAKEFAAKVEMELLPLEIKTSGSSIKPNRTVDDWKFTSRYENISLPKEIRGKVTDYRERIYNSPIKTSAGSIHFGSNASTDVADRYFAHSRIEDIVDNSIKHISPTTGRTMYISPSAAGGKNKASTRRVIEIQSDLFQKGRLENEINKGTFPYSNSGDIPAEQMRNNGWTEAEIKEALADSSGGNAKIVARNKERIAKLEPYRNLWHERVIKEEVKQAAKDGKTKLQFPTGETGMKIEGLAGESNSFIHVDRPMNLTPDDLEIGLRIKDRNNDEWVVTGVYRFGKFDAVRKERLESYGRLGDGTQEPLEETIKNIPRSEVEAFDIGEGIDKENPIYKFYEKEVGRYLKNKYNAKLITDKQGVTWWELDVPKEAKNSPIEAFAAAPLIGAPFISKKKKDKK